MVQRYERGSAACYRNMWGSTHGTLKLVHCCQCHQCNGSLPEVRVLIYTFLHNAQLVLKAECWGLFSFVNVFSASIEWIKSLRKCIETFIFYINNWVDYNIFNQNISRKDIYSRMHQPVFVSKSALFIASYQFTCLAFKLNIEKNNMWLCECVHPFIVFW